ncbi:hypothetical protein U1701_07535 [Sphingomonas sp. PB2P19]|uniref:phage integrase central domain-containing protein n=1 Tax=Sphingomonas rhamnosi TaxID=3096156 RepID=UPI003B8BBFAB
MGQRLDPGAKDKSPVVTTFEQAARARHANRLASLDVSHASQLLTRLGRDAFTALGKRDLKAVISADVLAMVRSVEARAALNVSRRLKQHVSQIYRFAIPRAGRALIRPNTSPSCSSQNPARDTWRGSARRSRGNWPGRLIATTVTRRPSDARSPALRCSSRWARTNETKLAAWE